MGGGEGATIPRFRAGIERRWCMGCLRRSLHVHMCNVYTSHTHVLSNGQDMCFVMEVLNWNGARGMGRAVRMRG